MIISGMKGNFHMPSRISCKGVPPPTATGYVSSAEATARHHKAMHVDNAKDIIVFKVTVLPEMLQGALLYILRNEEYIKCHLSLWTYHYVSMFP